MKDLISMSDILTWAGRTVLICIALALTIGIVFFKWPSQTRSDNNLAIVNLTETANTLLEIDRSLIKRLDKIESKSLYYNKEVIKYNHEVVKHNDNLVGNQKLKEILKQ